MLADHSNLPKHNPNATVLSIDDFMSLDSTVTKIIIDNGVNEPDLTELDLTRFSQLNRLIVGDHCFSYVNELKLIGMNELECVVIGSNSFTKHKNGYGQDANRHFHLKNCPKLNSLKMGCYSFSDYRVCEIENVNALEVIEIGELHGRGYSFYYASLELKSIQEESD